MRPGFCVMIYGSGGPRRTGVRGPRPPLQDCAEGLGVTTKMRVTGLAAASILVVLGSCTQIGGTTPAPGGEALPASVEER
jgi:hypothetical protein